MYALLEAGPTVRACRRYADKAAQHQLDFRIHSSTPFSTVMHALSDGLAKSALRSVLTVLIGAVLLLGGSRPSEAIIFRTEPTPLFGVFGSPQPNPVALGAVFSDPNFLAVSDSISVGELGRGIVDTVTLTEAPLGNEAGGPDGGVPVCCRWIRMRFPLTNWTFQAGYALIDFDPEPLAAIGFAGDGLWFLNAGTNADIWFGSDVNSDPTRLASLANFALDPLLPPAPPDVDVSAVTLGPNVTANPDGSFTIPNLPSAAPEPSTILLLGLGMVGAAIARQRQRKA